MRLLSSTHILAGVVCAFMLIFFLLDPAKFGKQTLGELGEPRLQARQQPAVIATSEFLRRANHASTVVGQWVYIDGGQFSFLNNGTPNYQYSTTILSIDLSQDWINSTVAIQSTVKPDGAPNLNVPSLWYDESRELLYSGFMGKPSSFDIDENPELPPPSLWTFKPDSFGSGTWTELFNPTATVWERINRVNYPYVAWDNTIVHVLGGYVYGNGTPPTAGEVRYSNGTPLAGEVRFDMLNQTFSNSTVENGADFTNGRAHGAMQFIPAFGPEGLFVAMGGQDVFNNLLSFDSVLIFDPSTQDWYNQTTTGSPPTPRREFCAPGISSTNNTYEM